MSDTPEPMTDERLQQIQQRADVATKGPWEYDGQHNEITTPREDSYWLVVSECRSAPDQTIERDQFGHGFDNNFQFIAHSREDVPALVAEVRRQREELNKANSLAVERLELLSKLVERMDFLKDANVRPFLLVFDVNNGARHIDTADAIRALNHVRAAEAPHE